VFSECTVRLKCVRNHRPQLTHAACKVCAYECNELVTWIRMYPYTVLEADESSPLKERSQPGTGLAAAFGDIKHENAPLTIPSYRLGDAVLVHENLLYMRPTLVGQMQPTTNILDYPALLQYIPGSLYPAIECLAARLTPVRVGEQASHLRRY